MTELHPSKPVRSVEISGASIAMGKSRVLSGEDFRKSKAQRQTVGSSRIHEFPRSGESWDFSAAKRARRRGRGRGRLPGILNSRSRESFLSRRDAIARRIAPPLIKYSIGVYKTPDRRMNLIMPPWTNIYRRRKHSPATRKLTRHCLRCEIAAEYPPC